MQRNNKQKIRVIKRSNHWQSAFVGKGLLANEQNEQSVEGNAHTEVRSKKQIISESIYASWKHLSHTRKSYVSDQSRVRIMKFVDSCVPTYHAT